ncbi:hypothetical protein [Pseudogulbenkiania sp. NH8B]|uniref:hypothetical protein n=1 Tax=Pseudogulbenkiania sp. (strain NH8B) TaxID=748280 RepID=UPI0009FF94CB|nr:hypothetical protein [Pseudogulbenkiania sp. NH8B]
MSAKLDRLARQLGLHLAGVPAPAPTPAPARRVAKLANVTAALNAASAKLPPPAPRPPAPARQPPRLTSMAIQRDSNGKIAAVSVAGSNGSRHHLAAQRDAFGRMSAVVIDDHSVWRVERGYDNQISGLTPMEHDK